MIAAVIALATLSILLLVGFVITDTERHRLTAANDDLRARLAHATVETHLLRRGSLPNGADAPLHDAVVLDLGMKRGGGA